MSGSRLRQRLILHSRSGQAAPAAVSIGGYLVGQEGEVGSIYEGYKLSWGDDFNSLDILGPAAPRGKWLTTRTYLPGARGSDTLLGTMYDTDPKFTGHNDSNRGAAVGYSNMSAASSAIALQARKATAGEIAHFQGSGRLNVAAMLSGIGAIAAYPSTANTGDVIFEWRAKWSAKAGNPAGWHPTLWTLSATPSTSIDSDEVDFEGNSQGGYLHRSVWTGGTPSASSAAGAVDIYDGGYHTITLILNTTNARLYIDGVLTKTGAWNTNTKGKPAYPLMTSHIYDGSFEGESNSPAAWAADADGATMTVDWCRVWRRSAKSHFRPLVTLNDVNVAYGASTVITLPSVATIWGDGTVTEYLQSVMTEENEPGASHSTAYDQFPTGVSYNAGTRELTVNIASGMTGRLNFVLHGYKADGSTCEPARFAVNVGPRLSASELLLAGTGTADLYAICECGVLTSDASGARAKTISVSGLPANVSYSDATGLLTSTGASNGTTAISVTITNSLGQSVTSSLDLTINAYEAETNALLALFTVQPDATRKGHINTLIASLKNGATSGTNIFAGLDFLHVYAAHDEQAARRNWIQDAYHSGAINSPTFTSDRGFAGNGTSSYLDTNFNPTTASSPKFTQNNASGGVWSRTAAQESVSVFGWFDNSDGFVINPRNTSDQMATRANEANSVNFANSDGSGWFCAGRSASASTRAYKNGASVGTGSGGSSALNNATFKTGHVTGTTYSTREVAADYAGRFLTLAEQADLYNAVRTYLLAVGATT
jgi:hypothetical protein